MDFTKQDAFINNFLVLLEDYQKNYIKTSSVYFQGLKTHSSIPSTDVQPNKLTDKPLGKTTSWADTGLDVNKAIPVSIEVHEYIAPEQQKGWQVFFYATDGIKNYIKSVGYGSESKERTKDWQEIVPILFN